MSDFTGAVNCHVISEKRLGCSELMGNVCLGVDVFRHSTHLGYMQTRGEF